MKEFKGALFDLDGVIVDTARYHFLAWRRLAAKVGVHLSELDNERLKGVSRMQSLAIILEMGGLHKSEAEKRSLAEMKNEWYVEYIRGVTAAEILPGAREYLLRLRRCGIKTAICSASKNARLILDKLQLAELFESIVDGNKVTKAKPDPEIFLRGARELLLKPDQCTVFEDAAAGIEAAKRAGMQAVGIGDREILKDADLIIAGLDELLTK